MLSTDSTFCCCVLAISSQGPCLLKGKKHVWLQEPWGSSLSLQDGDIEKLDPLISTPRVAVLDIQHLPTFSELWRSQVKLPAPVWTLFSLPLLQSQGLFSSPLWQGPVWGFHTCSVPPEEAYGWHKGTKTDKLSDIERQKHDRKIWAKSLGVCSLNVSQQFGWEGLWVLGTVRGEKDATGP